MCGAKLLDARMSRVIVDCTNLKSPSLKFQHVSFPSSFYNRQWSATSMVKVTAPFGSKACDWRTFGKFMAFTLQPHDHMLHRMTEELQGSGNGSVPDKGPP